MTKLTLYLEQLKDKTQKITEIDLKREVLDDSHIKLLVTALETNNSVTTLKLNNNSIGLEGVKCLAELLKKNTTLTHINLAANVIGEEGAKYLAEGIKENQHILLINLAKNTVHRNMKPLVAMRRIFKNNSAIFKQKEKDWVEIKKAARILAQGCRSENSIFFKMPAEMGVKIAASVAKFINEKEAEDIAYKNFSFPSCK